jgi:hypothetical protein
MKIPRYRIGLLVLGGILFLLPYKSGSGYQYVLENASEIEWVRNAGNQIGGITFVMGIGMGLAVSTGVTQLCERRKEG